MELALRRTDADTLWRVTSFGTHELGPGRNYWHDNEKRAPLGTVVVQAVMEGRIVLRDGRHIHDVPAGRLLLFVFGDQSSYGWPEPLPQRYRCQWLNLHGEGLVEHVSAYRNRYGPVLDYSTCPTLLDDLKRLQRMARPGAGTGATYMALAVHQYLMRLFEHAATQLYQAQSPAERALEHLLRHPTQPLSLKQVADRFGCSREHLTRLFRERTGQSPAVFLNQARLRRALDLLNATELPISAVAEQAGFSSTHTLARHVRRATGEGPSALRAGGR